MRIAHCADLHLDCAPHATTPAMRSKTWRGNIAVYRAMMKNIIEAEPDVFIHAGDMFNHGRPSPEALLLGIELLRPVAEAGIPIVLVEGNHERLHHLNTQRTTTLVVREALSRYGEVLAATDTPKLLHTRHGIPIAAVPWMETWQFLHDHNLTGADLDTQNQAVAEHITNLFATLAGQENGAIAAAHLTVTGASRGSEKDLTLLFREPVINATDLDSLGFGYVALGHLHTHQQLTGKVVYSGSPQRFTFADENIPKGWVLVEDGTPQFRETLARPFTTIHAGQPLPDLAPKTTVRVVLEPGETRIPPEVTQLIENTGSRLVQVKQQPATPPSGTRAAVDVETITPQDALSLWAERNNHNPSLLAKWAASLV